MSNSAQNVTPESCPTRQKSGSPVGPILRGCSGSVAFLSRGASGARWGTNLRCKPAANISFNNKLNRQDFLHSNLKVIFVAKTWGLVLIFGGLVSA